MKELYFAAGLLIGAGVSWYFTKKYYDQIREEEAKSFRESLRRIHGVPEKEYPEDEKSMEVFEEDPDIPVPSDEEVVDYVNHIHQYDYTGDSKEDIMERAKKRPFVIPPEEFDMLDDYTPISLTYYADGVLADDDNRIIENVEEVVGTDSLTHFGEYEDDCVMVRNDKFKCDYEIIRDLRNYSEVLMQLPDKAGD